MLTHLDQRSPGAVWRVRTSSFRAQRVTAQTHCANPFTLSEARAPSSFDRMNGSRSQRAPRARRQSSQVRPVPVHPIGTPTNGLSPNTGPLATAAWLIAHGLTSREPRWFVEVTLGVAGRNPDEDAATQLRIELFSEEWGFWFRHEGKISWIRVTDVAFVHGRDEHSLLPETPALKNIGRVVHALERRFDIRFDRAVPLIRTSLVGEEQTISAWIASWSSETARPRTM
jgi:hypothetical protein